MVDMLRGRHAQFYIDIIYGIAFSLAFGYLIFVEMDQLIAAFAGGLVLGYFLRVWENMTVYERVLHEAVAEEVADQVPGEAEEAVAEEVAQQVPGEVEDEVSEAVETRVDEEIEEHLEHRLPEE